MEPPFDRRSLSPEAYAVQLPLAVVTGAITAIRPCNPVKKARRAENPAG